GYGSLMRTALFVVAALAACTKSSPPAPSPSAAPPPAPAAAEPARATSHEPADCAAVASRVGDLGKAALARDPTRRLARLAPALVTAGVASGTEAGGPAEARTCLASAATTDLASANLCVGAMPHDPQAKLIERVAGVLDTALRGARPRPIA